MPQASNPTDLLLPYQKRWLICKDRYAIYLKSRRIGISYVEALRAVTTRLEKKEDYWFISRDEKAGKEFIGDCKKWAGALNALSDQSVINLSNATTEQIVFPNGSRITALTSAPDVLRGKGGSVTLDEFAFHEHGEELYTAAQPVIMWGGKLRIISTPNGADTAFDKIYCDVEGFTKFTTTLIDAVKDGLALKVPGDHRAISDRQKCDEAFIAGIRRSCLSENSYRQEYLCEKVTAKGMVYKSFADPQADVYPVKPPFERFTRPVVYSWGAIDWGWEDPMVVLVFCETDDGQVYCVEEIYEHHMGLDQLGARLQNLQNKWGASTGKYAGIRGGSWLGFFCDTANPLARQLMSRFAVSIQNNRVKDILAGISVVDTLYTCGKLKIFDTCKMVIAESKRYQYQDNGKPSGTFDHAMDALRYGCASAFYTREIIPQERTPTDNIETMKRLGLIESEKDIERKQIEDEERRQREWQIQMMLDGIDGRVAVHASRSPQPSLDHLAALNGVK